MLIIFIIILTPLPSNGQSIFIKVNFDKPIDESLYPLPIHVWPRFGDGDCGLDPNKKSYLFVLEENNKMIASLDPNGKINLDGGTHALMIHSLFYCLYNQLDQVAQLTKNFKDWRKKTEEVQKSWWKIF